MPYEWRKMWQGPKIASDFLKSVIIRIQTAMKFMNSLDSGIEEIDLSKIFNVDSFLSTVKLITSRDLKVSTSKLTMNSFTDDSQYERMKNKHKNLIKISPLLVDGLSFFDNRLVAPDGYSSSNTTKNIYIHFQEASNTADEQHTFTVPLYSNYSREKILCNIKMNSLIDENEIIYSGTALIVPMN